MSVAILRLLFFFFKQKTAYEMRISDWSSDVCSSDLLVGRLKSTRQQDLLRFVDPVSQRTLALRPDITAQVGRIATTRMARVPRPLRLAYGGAVLKVRGTQLRPEREKIGRAHV